MGVLTPTPPIEGAMSAPPQTPPRNGVASIKTVFWVSTVRDGVFCKTATAYQAVSNSNSGSITWRCRAVAATILTKPDRLRQRQDARDQPLRRGV